MCQLFPVFKSCCGVSVRIAMIYIAVTAIVTGAIINGALKKTGIDVSTINIRNLQDHNDTADVHWDYALDDDPVQGTEFEYEDPTTEATTTTTASTTTTTTTTEAPEVVVFRYVSSVNRNGMNLLASAFILLGILLLVTNFLDSPELGFISVIATITVSVASLVLMICVVVECAKDKRTCLMSKLDWFSGFIISLFWAVYSFVWLFFAGVVNAYANGTY